jgi:hypothetical protein
VILPSSALAQTAVRHTHTKPNAIPSRAIVTLPLPSLPSTY